MHVRGSSDKLIKMMPEHNLTSIDASLFVCIEIAAQKQK